MKKFYSLLACLSLGFVGMLGGVASAADVSFFVVDHYNENVMLGGAQIEFRAFDTCPGGGGAFCYRY